MPSWSIRTPISGRCRSRLLFLTGGPGALMPASPVRLALYFWQDGPARLLVFAVFMPPANGCAAIVLPAFPGILPAYGWGASLAILQSTAVIGRLWPDLSDHSAGRVAGGFAVRPSRKRLLSGNSRRRWRCCFCSRCLWGWGAWRLAANPTAICCRACNLRLVQPDIPQREKYDRALWRATGSG